MTDANPHLDEAIEDPTMRELVRLSQTPYEGFSDDGTASATADGTGSITAVDLRDATDPGFAGLALTQAINAARSAARDGVRAGLADNDDIPADLRALMAQEPGAELDLAGTEPVHAPEGEFEGLGAGGRAVVRVDARTQQAASVYLTSLDDDVVAGVPEAANRAFAAAEMGREGATPLAEEIDGHLAALDAKLDAVQAKLGAVDDELDKILRSLG